MKETITIKIVENSAGELKWHSSSDNGFTDDSCDDEVLLELDDYPLGTEITIVIPEQD